MELHAPLGRRTSISAPAAPDAAVHVVHELIAAFNRHDAEAFAALFLPEAWFLNVIGQRFSGRPEIADSHRDVFANALAGSRVECQDVASRLVGDDVALVEAVWSSSEEDDGAMPSRRGIMSLVLHRDGGDRWQIVSGANVEPLAYP